MVVYILVVIKRLPRKSIVIKRLPRKTIVMNRLPRKSIVIKRLPRKSIVIKISKRLPIEVMNNIGLNRMLYLMMNGLHDGILKGLHDLLLGLNLYQGFVSVLVVL